MKRSEMIKTLQESVDWWTDHNCQLNTALASRILEDLEEAGMLPPGYLKPIPFESDGKQYPLIPGDFKNDEGVWCVPGVNEWEQE